MNWREGLHLVPVHMHDVVERWIEQGIPGGSFLTAVMENDFMQAVGRADYINLKYLEGWAEFLYNYAPSACHGSTEKVRAWALRGGLTEKVDLT